MRCLATAPLAIVSTLATALCPAPVRACSCMAQTVDTAIAESSAIFEGRVASVEPDASSSSAHGAIRVRFDVVQTWRAADAEHIEVLTPGDSAACGYAFELGHSYLVYAREIDGSLHAGLCSRTRPIEDAEEDRIVLGSGSIPVDIVDDRERPLRPRQELGPRGGCAGCAIGGDAPDLDALIAAIPLAWLAARRRGRR